MLISSLAKKIKPYVAGEQPQDGGWIKLNTNENPYACTEFSLPQKELLRLYPDPNATKLKEAIAYLHNVSVENVFVGNGSDEVLAVCYQALFERDSAQVLVPDITYSFYPVYANLYGINYRTIPLNEKFEINVDDYCFADKNSSNCSLSSILTTSSATGRNSTDSDAIGGIIFANPNAPTSVALKRGEVKKIIESNPTVPVVVDEAYVDFCDQSVIDEVPNFENLVVVRTLSKSYSLAGIRAGYAVGSKELIDAMERIKNSFNSYPLDLFAQTVALSAIEHQEIMTANVKKIIATREWTIERLRELGFECLESSSNFILAKPVIGGAISGVCGSVGHSECSKTNKYVSGKEIFDYLKENKILVRRWDAPRIKDYLRISIGTDLEMKQLIDVLKKY